MVLGIIIFDFGSGFGEMFCSWVCDYQIVGIGVDMSLLFSQQVVVWVEEFGVSDWVIFVYQDVSGYVVSQLCDVVVCVGVMWIGGGVVGIIELLKQSFISGGMLFIGELWWCKCLVMVEEVIVCGVQLFDDFLMLLVLVVYFGELGYDVVEMVLVDQEGWDCYEVVKWLIMCCWLEVNLYDDFVLEVCQQLIIVLLYYVIWIWEYFGWGVFVLMVC